MVGIRPAVQARLVQLLRSVKPKHASSGGGGGQWKVLVIDKAAKAVLASAVRMFDLLQEDVAVIEPLELGRQPLKQMEAVYLMAPTAEGVAKLVEDFEGVEADPTPMYRAAHVFFLQPLPDELMTVIEGSDALVGRLAALAELNLDFLAVEERVFSLGRPEALVTCFSPESKAAAVKAELVATARQLATVCATLKEYPVIRCVPSAATAFDDATEVLGRELREFLDDLRDGSEEYKRAAITDRRGPRATLLIVDRSHDAMTPLLHEFTYQAMIYDVLQSKLDGDTYTYSARLGDGSKADKSVLLDETDVLFPRLRHMHIADSMEVVAQSFNTFVAENKTAKAAKKKIQTMRDMQDAMRSMPEYRELLEKYTLHINLSNDCMAQFRRQGLDAVAEVEQDLATGRDAKGDEPKNLIFRLRALLEADRGAADDDDDSDGGGAGAGASAAPAVEPLDAADKIRLLLAYVISQEGIKDEDRTRLLKLANLGVDDRQCVSNMRYLGVTLLRQPRVGKKKFFFLKDKKDSKPVLKENAPDYELSRYIPKFATLVEGAANGNLSADDATFVRESEEKAAAAAAKGSSKGSSKRDSGAGAGGGAATSVRKPKPGWAKKGKQRASGGAAAAGGAASGAGAAAAAAAAAEESSGQGRLIVFFLGGATYSEIRTAYTLAEELKRDIIIGGSSLIHPRQFVQSLRDLKHAEKADDQPAEGRRRRRVEA